MPGGAELSEGCATLDGHVEGLVEEEDGDPQGVCKEKGARMSEREGCEEEGAQMSEREECEEEGADERERRMRGIGSF